MAALMTREEIAAAWSAALARKREHRANVYRAYSEAEELQAKLDGRRLEKVSVYAPEFKDAESADQWWDDRIVERNSSWWGDPVTPVLFAVAVAARDSSAGAAAEAVRAAKQLEPRLQFSVYANLQLWRKHDGAFRFGAEQIVDRVLAEYERLRLPTEAPAAVAEPERRKRKWELTESEATP